MIYERNGPAGLVDKLQARYRPMLRPHTRADLAGPGRHGEAADPLIARVQAGSLLGCYLSGFRAARRRC